MQTRKLKARRKTSKRRRSIRHAGSKHLVPRTAKQYFAMPRESQEAWDRISQVPGKMRSEKLSRSQVVRELGVSRRQLHLARSAFRKLRNGRYVAKATDRLLRILVLPSDKGLIEVAVNDSRQATLIGEYWNAVHRYLSTGDVAELEKFRRKRVADASGKRILLVTDRDELGRLASAGVLQFESLYGRAA
jgi:hypothetical protein